jgi:endonuclease/exonuclease/phosphatase family metal-dependent hydrolase
MKQGLAVLARDPFHLSLLAELPHVPKYIIPVAVDGPLSFVLFAVWTQRQERATRAVRAACMAIDLYASTFREKRVVMLGDFNSNAIWDHRHPSTHNHSSMVARLEGYGLVSAYHYNKGEIHGKESEPTFFLHWKENAAYHIDCCFLPRDWAHRIQRVEIGSFAEWKEHSDHRPLVVELTPNLSL